MRILNPMKNIPLSLLQVLLFGLSLCSGNAQLVFTDDFNRANTGTVTTGLAMGNASYAITSANQYNPTLLQILDNAATGPGVIGASFAVLSYQGFTLNSANFTVSGLLKATSPLAAAEQWGVVWNFQDYNDFYWARISSPTGLQIGKMLNGVASADTYTIPSVATGTPYTMTVSSTAAYSFGISLVGGATNFSKTYTDAGNSFTGGYGGALWATPHAHLRVDSLSVTTIPEPTTWALLAFSLMTVLVIRRRRQSA